MTLTDNLPRNFRIEEEFQDQYSEIQRDGLFEETTNLEIFLVSLSLGWREENRVPLENPYPVVNVRTISDNKAWLIAAVAISEEGFSVLSDFNKVRKISEEYANGGFELLKSKINSVTPNKEVEKFQRELLEQMQS